GNLLERGGIQADVERIRTEPGERADIALRRRCPCLVVHRKRHFPTARQLAHAVLDRLPRRIALESLESKAEADLIVRRLKRRGIAEACYGDAANGDRVIDDVRENRILAGVREN